MALSSNHVEVECPRPYHLKLTRELIFESKYVGQRARPMASFDFSSRKYQTPNIKNLIRSSYSPYSTWLNKSEIEKIWDRYHCFFRSWKLESRGSVRPFCVGCDKRIIKKNFLNESLTQNLSLDLAFFWYYVIWRHNDVIKNSRIWTRKILIKTLI